jgi:hypothetical protein
MKLKDYLFEDPGFAPTFDDTTGPNLHMDMPAPSLLSAPPPVGFLSGQPMYDMQGYDQHTAMARRGVLGEDAANLSPAKLKASVLKMVSAIDTAKRSGNIKREQSAYEKLLAFTQEHGINFDSALTGARKHLNKKNPIGRAMSGFESLDERKLKPDYAPEGRDAQVLKRLENGKAPGVAPEGKGFCFLCANGTLHGFKFKNDAVRWLKADERNVQRAWYGDPIAPSGKFRIRVRDRYHKSDEAAARAAQQFVEEGSIDFHGLLSDEDTRAGWRANIAMAIYDTKHKRGETAHEWRQRCAERFLDILARPAEAVQGFGDFLEARRAR